MRITIFAGLVLAMSGAAAENVHVTVSLTTPEALEVRYELPADCAQLTFLKTGRGAAEIRSHWQAIDDCGEAGGDVLARSANRCKALTFRVPATTHKVTGYPGSYPTGEGHLCAHVELRGRRNLRKGQLPLYGAWLHPYRLGAARGFGAGECRCACDAIPFPLAESRSQP